MVKGFPLNALTVFAAIVAVVSFMSVSLLTGGSAMRATAALILSHPTEAGLVLLGAALLGLWRGLGPFPVACALVAMACFGLEIAAADFDGAAPAEILIGLTPSALAAVLALGVPSYATHAPEAIRFRVLATSALIGTMVSVGVLIALSIGSHSPASSPWLFAKLVGVGLVSGGYTVFLAVAPIASPSEVLRWFRVPIGVAGIAGIASLLLVPVATGVDDSRSLAIAALPSSDCSSRSAASARLRSI
jgi:hypothetical protein